MELQEDKRTMAQQLATAKDLELRGRAELNIAADEIANLKKKHAREVVELENELQKKESALRGADEELEICRKDLEHKREMVSSLNATISQQSNTQLTLSTEKHSLQAQVSSLCAELDACLRRYSEQTLALESAEKEAAELKIEVVESEAIRRKLHNQVQELKGNIRVFCRVRPVLPSDATNYGPASAGPSSASPTIEELEDMKAEMAFPDKRDHKEIVMRSTSESATGQERIENHLFSFDRVCPPCAPPNPY